MKWMTQRRAKRLAINKAEIRRRSRRLGPFMAGARAARLAKDLAETIPGNPHKPDSQDAKDWERGWVFEMEKPDGWKHDTRRTGMESRVEQAGAPEGETPSDSKE